MAHELQYPRKSLDKAYFFAVTGRNGFDKLGRVAVFGILGPEGTAFPVCDESKLVRDEIELAVQVNSRIRAKIVVPSSADNSTIEQIALADSAVIDALEGKTPKQVIVIKNRLVNIVV